MLNRKNKKGFTLAELLIVVAIIAILVAIAVPLFVGSLKDAEEATKNANIRAVRGAAVVAILKDKDYDAHKANGWKATACITKTGEIKNLAITTDAGSGATADKCSDHSECKCAEGSTKCDCEYMVEVHIKETDLDSIKVTAAVAAA